MHTCTEHTQVIHDSVTAQQQATLTITHLTKQIEALKPKGSSRHTL
jgi:hypothetical protein